MSCFKKSEWRSERKRVQDYKFDFVDIDDFYQRSFLRKLKYSLVFLVVIKTILVYIADLWTAGILLIFGRFETSIKPKIPIQYSKWIYFGAILVSFILLAWDLKKARPIIISKDISYTFTSLIATRFYTLRSYAHYCFFAQIQESPKMIDTIAFFVFFTFKGWKRLLFAELPRQAVNAVTLYSIILTNRSRKYWDITAYGNNIVQRLATALMAFSFAVFILSFSLLILAFILYIPLLFHIRGNLKEYCCHKVDKRIAELLKMNSRKRIERNKQDAEALANGDFSHLKKKKGALPPKEPTIPDFVKNDTQTPHYMGIPPTYGSRSGSPVPSRPGTPGGYPSRPGTPVYRAGTLSRPGTPGYGPNPYGPPQPNPVLTRRNSGSSVMSGMTNISAYTHTTTHGLTGPGGYHPYGPPNRSQTPPTMQPNRSYVARAAYGPPSEKSDNDDDRYSEYGGSQYGGSQSSDGTSIKPLLNRYNEQDLYRAPSPAPRSYSPAPSISSTRSHPPGPQGALPSRYQQDIRTPRYNNYTQQGGGRNRN